MEHYDGEFYTLRLFSPIEGEIYSLNSTEEGIHLTAYEMENYSSFIRDHMEGVGLLGKRNQKLMTYFNNAKRLHKPVSLSLDLEAYEGRLWSVLQADSQDKLTHEEVQSLAETWGMIAAGGFIREMQETRILVPDGELMVFLGNEGLDYFVCPEEVLKGTAHTLKPALDVAIYSEAYFPERSYQGAKLRLPAEPAFLKDAKMRAFIHENEPYRIELLGNWPSFLKNILEKAASVTLEEVNVLACLVTHMDSSQIETYEAAIQMRQEENIDVLVGIKELLNLCYNLECFKFLRGIIDDRKLGEFYLEEDRLEWIHMLEVDIRELLDPQRVGMDQRKEEMGIFTSKGYVFENALSYQDIYDGIHLPDIDGVAGGIFSLRLVGSQYPEEQGTWLELPTTDLGFQWALNRLNERTFDDCIITESISTVHGLSVKQTDDIETLNELARQLQEFPDDRTLCKFKAALELEQCDSLEQALRIAENLDCYSYDPQMYSMASYARYLFRELEFNIDDPAFATLASSFYDEGVSIQTIRDYLGHNNENMTKQYIDYMPKRIEQANKEYFNQAENLLATGIIPKKRGEKTGK